MTKQPIAHKEGVVILQTAITSLAGTPYFDKKLDVMNALLDLEFQLRQELYTDDKAISEEFEGRETSWSD